MCIRDRSWYNLPGIFWNCQIPLYVQVSLLVKLARVCLTLCSQCFLCVFLQCSLMIVSVTACRLTMGRRRSIQAPYVVLCRGKSQHFIYNSWTAWILLGTTQTQTNLQLRLCSALSADLHDFVCPPSVPFAHPLGLLFYHGCVVQPGFTSSIVKLIALAKKDLPWPLDIIFISIKDLTFVFV